MANRLNVLGCGLLMLLLACHAHVFELSLDHEPMQVVGWLTGTDQ